VEEAAASKASVSPLSKHREAQEEPGVNSRARERTVNVDKTRRRAEDNRAMVAESYVEGEVRRVGWPREFSLVSSQEFPTWRGGSCSRLNGQRTYLNLEDPDKRWNRQVCEAYGQRWEQVL
jgi:hypothetical protein